MEKKLHLYVWDLFAPEWNYGLAFAIAENEDAARELVAQAMGYVPSDWGRHDRVATIQSSRIRCRRRLLNHESDPLSISVFSSRSASSQ